VSGTSPPPPTSFALARIDSIRCFVRVSSSVARLRAGDGVCPRNLCSRVRRMALDFSRVYTLGFLLGGAEAAQEGKSAVLQLVVGFRDVFWSGEMDCFSKNLVSLGWDYSETRLERGPNQWIRASVYAIDLAIQYVECLMQLLPSPLCLPFHGI
jgi:hypothetical protein